MEGRLPAAQPAAGTPRPYGRSGAATRRSDAAQPKASMVQQAAVGAASFIDYLAR